MSVGRGWKKGYSVIISILVIASLYIFYRVKKQDFLQDKLPGLVNSKTNRLYQLSYDSISVDEVGGDLYIKNLYLKPDTTRQLAMINAGDTNAAKTLFDIYIPLLTVEDFKTAGALISKQMDCKRILINDPRITMHVFP